MKILGYEVCEKAASEVVDLAMASSQTFMINTLNPHSYVVAKTDALFKKALMQSDVLLPDGSGVVFAARFVNRKLIRKVSGMDLFIAALGVLEPRSSTVLFMGSTEQVLGDLKKRVEREFPALVVKTFSPPYKAEFSSADVTTFTNVIKASKADAVFLGLTAPKQEKLGRAIGEIDDVKMIAGVGAVFDFYSGNVKRPHAFWVRFHLEWLIRFLGEPKRLWRRNFVSTPIFLKDCLLARARAR